MLLEKGRRTHGRLIKKHRPKTSGFLPPLNAQTYLKSLRYFQVISSVSGSHQCLSGHHPKEPKHAQMTN